MLDKNKAKLKRKKERETFVGFRPSSIDHAKIYTRKQKHKKDYSTEEQSFFYWLIQKYYNIFNDKKIFKKLLTSIL